jgi:hypothetical protein
MLPIKSPPRVLYVILALLVGFMLMILSCSGVMPPPQQLAGKPVSVKKMPDLLQTCVRVTDRDLKICVAATIPTTLRWISALPAAQPSVNVNFSRRSPWDRSDLNGNQATFNNGNVSFQAGVGSTSMGKGSPVDQRGR